MDYYKCLQHHLLAVLLEVTNNVPHAPLYHWLLFSINLFGGIILVLQTALFWSKPLTSYYFIGNHFSLRSLKDEGSFEKCNHKTMMDRKKKNEPFLNLYPMSPSLGLHFHDSLINIFKSIRFVWDRILFTLSPLVWHIGGAPQMLSGWTGKGTEWSHMQSASQAGPCRHSHQILLVMLRGMPFVVPFYRGHNWGTERWNDLPKAREQGGETWLRR